eukprot:10564255-Ditylum_brightwellii.AAC.1
MLASSTFSPRRIVIHSPLVSSILRKPSSPQSTLSSSLPVRTSRLHFRVGPYICVIIRVIVAVVDT